MTDESLKQVEVIKAYFDSVASQDADRVAAHYTEDYVLELPYFKPNEPLVIEGRAAVHAYLAELLPAQKMNLTLTRVHALPEEQLLITEHACEGEFVATGAPYVNRYVGYWTFRGNLIARLCEYYNPQVPGASAID